MINGTLANGSADNTQDMSANDAILIGQLANRGTKVKTAAPFEPSGKWETKEDMLESLSASREKLIEYLNSSDMNMRHYVSDLPIGRADMYQVFLVISAHSQRHTFQMMEVLAEANS